MLRLLAKEPPAAKSWTWGSLTGVATKLKSASSSTIGTLKMANVLLERW